METNKGFSLWNSFKTPLIALIHNNHDKMSNEEKVLELRGIKDESQFDFILNAYMFNVSLPLSPVI